VVHDAAGRADDDLRAGFEGAELPLVGLPAVDRHRVDAALEGGEFGGLLGVLYGEFARGAEDEHLHGLYVRIGALDRGDGKGGRFTGTGRGLANDIAS